MPKEEKMAKLQKNRGKFRVALRNVFDARAAQKIGLSQEAKIWRSSRKEAMETLNKINAEVCRLRAKFEKSGRR